MSLSSTFCFDETCPKIKWLIDWSGDWLKQLKEILTGWCARATQISSLLPRPPSRLASTPTQELQSHMWLCRKRYGECSASTSAHSRIGRVALWSVSFLQGQVCVYSWWLSDTVWCWERRCFQWVSHSASRVRPVHPSSQTQPDASVSGCGEVASGARLLYAFSLKDPKKKTDSASVINVQNEKPK